MHRTRLAALFGALLIGSLLLAGCGNKGPLKMPDGSAQLSFGR